MALNQFLLEGTIATRPQRTPSSPGYVEFILEHKSSQDGRTDFFSVEISDYLCPSSKIKKGVAVLLRGSLEQRQWVDAQAGDIRSGTKIHAYELKILAPSPRPNSAPGPIAEAEGVEEISF